MVKLWKKNKDDEDSDEIISWKREDKELLERPIIYSYPQLGDNIENKEAFAVRDYERALFYNKGELIDSLAGGVYELDKEDKITGTEIVYVDTSFIEIPWGIPLKNGVPSRDKFKIGLYGDLKLRISDVKKFYNDVVAGKKDWTVQVLKDWILSLLWTSIRDIFKNYLARQIIREERERVINLVASKVTEEFIQYGLQFESFNILGEKPEEGALAVDEACRDDIKKCIEEKETIQDRIDKLKKDLDGLQDKLLDSEITQAEYDEKEKLITGFIAAKENELESIQKKISELES